nr:hypothetical protein [Tanacetum cinerariifolium]
MGRNLEAYVDDMVIKSKTKPEMIKDVEETVLTLNKEMKKLIVELPTLTAPKKEEELMVYLSAANEAISVVLLVERKGKEASIHYVSRTLEGAEINYPPMEKLALALVHAARRLRRYFQGTMTEDSPTQVKAKELNKILEEAESMEEHEAMETKAPENLRTKVDIWKLYTDEAYNKHRSRAGLRIATKMKVKKMHAFVDSKLVACQWKDHMKKKGEKTKKYKEKALEMIWSFNNFQISHIPMEENRKADALKVNAIIEEATRTWMTPIQEYIKKKILPKDATEA